MDTMKFYLYAHVNTDEEWLNTALVGSYDTVLEAAEAMEDHIMSRPNEGLYFSMWHDELDEGYITHTYDALVKIAEKGPLRGA
jgi:hypothetical protein